MVKTRFEFRRPGFDPRVEKIPFGERGRGRDMATHSRILAWRIPMDRGAWGTTVHGVAKSPAGLSDFHFH